MSEITRKNHFVSQLYLKNWSSDNKKVWRYRILAPHNREPLWKLLSIEGIAYHKDLYTSMIDNQEVDEFEKWLKREFEDPVQEALSKVLNDEKLTAPDWERLIMFLAAQDVRTPTNYIEFMQRWSDSLPKVIEETLVESINIFEDRLQKGPPIELPKIETGHAEVFEDVFDIRIVPAISTQSNEPEIMVKTILGRNLWLKNQQFLLRKTAKALLEHKWSIVKPSSGDYWFTSDHPVVRLNYSSSEDYDLRGGWGNPGGYIFMPLSPQHLLFTQVGTDLPDQDTFSYSTTLKIQKFLAEKAHRSIYAHHSMPLVSILRPRRVDLNAFNSEKKQWEEWHNQQNEAEASIRSSDHNSSLG